jgi:hypothetical protein
MTINLTRENLMFVIILVLMLIQIHQYLVISRLKREFDSIMLQFANFILAVTTKMTEIDTKMKLDEKDK